MIHSCHLLPDCSLHLAGPQGKPTLDPRCGSGFSSGSAGRKNVICEYPIYTRFLTYPKSSKNHPLTPEQKAENQVISTFRIRVEHTIAGIKRFRCLTDAYRNKGTILADKFMLIACGLWNSSPLACLILLSLRYSYHFSSTLFRNTSNALLFWHSLELLNSSLTIEHCGS